MDTALAGLSPSSLLELDTTAIGCKHTKSELNCCLVVWIRQMMTQEAPATFLLLAASQQHVS